MSATYAVCVNNDDYPAALEVGKIYRTLPDDHAEKHNLIRVIDESFEDYLYPTTYFTSLASHLTPLGSTLIGTLADELRDFGKPMWLGWISASDAEMLMDPSPDLAFFTPGRIADGAGVDAYVQSIPDLVVEMKMSSDTTHDTGDIVQRWLSCGTQMAWVFNPVTRSVDVLAQGDAISTLNYEGILDGRDILPGFACSVKDIFDGAGYAT